MNITISKEELLEKLVENRRQHVEVYALAAEAYQKLLVTTVKELLADVEAGKTIQLYIRPGVNPPVNYGEDYDQAIAMVEMSGGDTVELNSQDFSHFILDDWHWKQDFTATLASGKLCINELGSYSNYSQ